jgi:hypothetical protein
MTEGGKGEWRPGWAPKDGGVAAHPGVRLRCVFYAEFDNLLGPTLRFQAPEGFLSADDFAAVRYSAPVFFLYIKKTDFALSCLISLSP